MLDYRVFWAGLLDIKPKDVYTTKNYVIACFYLVGLP